MDHRSRNPEPRAPGLLTRTSPTQPDPRGPVALAVRGLHCRYGDFEAVGGIDLTVRRGETFALLGTNGAGKTTTLETLEGQRAPDDGDVEVLGLDPRADRRALAARIGVMFQASGLPGDLTPHELLDVWTRLTPDARSHLDVRDALTRVQIDHRAEVRIRQLSGGERRRLDLALALVNRPELIFLDEPTTGMDPQARERTWQILRDLRDDGVTIMLTTHYLEEAEALADRLAIMHAGRLAAAGTLAEVVASQPATIRAALPATAPELPPPVGDAEVGAGGEVTIATRHLQRDLTDLLLWAREHDLYLEGLQASEASLAQVFHAIAGTNAPGGAGRTAHGRRGGNR
ncbi:MAG: ABC transporter ATP-binding protein [Nitriliruptoraceae bacterium]